MSSAARPLENISVVSIATNVPGPVAAARFDAARRDCDQVEPPSGDLVARVAPDYYASSQGQEVVTLDLKTEEGGVALEALPSVADVFITSHRPSALARLGLGWDAVHSRHPRLCHVAIVTRGRRRGARPRPHIPGGQRPHLRRRRDASDAVHPHRGPGGQSAPQRRPWPHCSPGSGPARAATARSPCS